MKKTNENNKKSSRCVENEHCLLGILYDTMRDYECGEHDCYTAQLIVKYAAVFHQLRPRSQKGVTADSIVCRFIRQFFHEIERGWKLANAGNLLLDDVSDDDLDDIKREGRFLNYVKKHYPEV